MVDLVGLALDELYELAYAAMGASTAERERYVYHMRDLLSAGPSKFLEDMQTVRAWCDRILNMLQDIRRLHIEVSRRSDMVVLDLEFAIVQRQVEQDIPKLTAAGDRKVWARKECQTEELLSAKWNVLKQELGAHIKLLDGQLKHLMTAKQDMRAQLWAARLQMFVGEVDFDALRHEGKSLEEELLPPWKRSGGSFRGEGRSTKK